MVSWIVTGAVLVVVIAAYVVLFLYTRKRQKAFDAQYNSMKERHEVFVLSKKVSRERPKQRWGRFIKVKTYQVVGRVTVSQAVKGMQMSKMQTVTFQTTKPIFDKIQPNHKYKMDIAGNYIGRVIAPSPSKGSKGNTKQSVEPVKRRGWRSFLPGQKRTGGARKNSGKS